VNYLKIRTYLDFIKIEHSLFALPLAYSGAFFAGELTLKLCFLILTAFLGLRSAAMSLNRIIDRDIDAKNPRTAKRHLPSGIISLNEAYAITFFSLALYFVSAYLISELVFILSPIPALLSYIYPYLKRFTSLCHYFLGLNLSLAPIGGWIAVKNSIYFFKDLSFFLFSISIIFWVAGFDIVYSLQDLEFDRKEGLHSIPAKFGYNLSIWISRINHIFFVLLLLISFSIYNIQIFSILIAFLVLLEHIAIKSGKLEVAFFHLNALISFLMFTSSITKSFGV